jgi:hypothetical protein
MEIVRAHRVDQRFDRVDERFNGLGGELLTIRGQPTEILARLAS